MTKFNWPVNKLSENPAFQLTAHNATPVYMQVSIVLWELPNCHMGYRMSQVAMGFSHNSYLNFTKRFFTVILSECSGSLRWPPRETDYADGAYNFQCPDGEFGSTKLITIHKTKKQSEQFRDRKENLSLNLLAVYDATMRCIYAYVGESSNFIILLTERGRQIWAHPYMLELSQATTHASRIFISCTV